MMRRRVWTALSLVTGGALVLAIAAVLLGSPSPVYSSGIVPANKVGPGRCAFANNRFTCTGRAELVVTAADGTKLLVRGPFSAQFGVER